jgi:hypothetical protein
MEQESAYYCSQCGIIKGPNNGWFHIFVVKADAGSLLGASFTVTHFRPQRNALAKGRSCGFNCNSILLARWMSSGSIDKPGDSSEKT